MTLDYDPFEQLDLNALVGGGSTPATRMNRCVNLAVNLHAVKVMNDRACSHYLHTLNYERAAQIAGPPWRGGWADFKGMQPAEMVVMAEEQFAAIVEKMWRAP